MADVDTKRKSGRPAANPTKKEDDSKKRVAPAENGDVVPAKRGRGRPPKKSGAKKVVPPKSKGPSKGRGRPAKGAAKKKVESEDEENAESGTEESS